MDWPKDGSRASRAADDNSTCGEFDCPRVSSVAGLQTSLAHAHIVHFPSDQSYLSACQQHCHLNHHQLFDVILSLQRIDRFSRHVVVFQIEETVAAETQDEERDESNVSAGPGVLNHG